MFEPISLFGRLGIIETSIRRAGSPNGDLITEQQAEELLLSVQELREYANDKEKESTSANQSMPYHTHTGTHSVNVQYTACDPK